MYHSIYTKRFTEIQQELEELEKEKVTVAGKLVKPSQCYHLGIDPPHILFNTNCPDTLKERITSILSRYAEQESHGNK
jgi:hypothetical protein